MSILSLPTDMDSAGVDSRYRLVVLAAQRARQMMDAGTSPGESRYTKVTTRALEEILQGTCEILRGEEARQAQREERRVRDALRVRTRGSEREESIAEAIRKDMNVYLEETPTPAVDAKPEPEDDGHE